MDLIYANKNRRDLGVLMSYTLDMAYGRDENDFVLTLDADSHCCHDGYYIYAEGTEYGGIVDRIGTDPDTNTVIYKGLTWHGVLEKRIVCPPSGRSYRRVDGEANSVLSEIISVIGLSGLYKASTEDSGITIHSYQIPRYIDAYTAIKNMLKAFDAKLIVRWKNGYVRLSAESVSDYSQDEEFDPSQVSFTVEKNYRPTNHLICLGQGELTQRAVIHLFTDNAGGVQPYATVSDPVRDSDYIRNTSRQVLFGADEVAEVLDYPGAETVTNYVKLTSQPSDWASKCESYFTRKDPEAGSDEETEKYEAVSKLDVGYVLQKSQPSDWDTNYSKYYTRSGENYNPVEATTAYNLLTQKPSDWTTKYENYYRKSGNSYYQLTGVQEEVYTVLNKAPADWARKYNTYYYLYSDGVLTEWKTVDGVGYYRYKLQTQKPTDWDTNYSNYYRKYTAAEKKKLKTQKQYVQLQSREDGTIPNWGTKRFYTRYELKKAPAWSANPNPKYIHTTEVNPPTWATNTYYSKDETAAPTWQANTYYTLSTDKVAPKWSANKYYREVKDRYATMVAEGIERLAEAWQTDSMGIALEETDVVYDIGDIVGVLEPKTGISTIQEVVKKIIKIDNDDIKIEYEVK